MAYAADKNLPYRLNQRWLDQEIDDRVLPVLIDGGYASPGQVVNPVEALLERHHVPPAIRARAIRAATEVTPGDRFRILLSGRSDFGPAGESASTATWSGITETPATAAEFRQVFHEFCRVGADRPAISDFHRHSARPFGLAEDLAPASRWKLYHDLLAAMRFAHEEVYADGSRSHFGTSRPYMAGGPTTWLTDVTYHCRTGLPPEPDEFLAECVNRDAVAAEWPTAAPRGAVVVKLPLPLSGNEAVLLAGDAAGAFRATCEAARARLAGVDLADRLAEPAGGRAGLPVHPIPLRVLETLDRYPPPPEFERLVSVPASEVAGPVASNPRGGSCPTSS